jgi:hypothetical protein
VVTKHRATLDAVFLMLTVAGGLVSTLTVFSTFYLVYQASAPPTNGWTKSSFGETLHVDLQGHVFLNGRNVVAVGFHVKHGSVNPTVTVANQMLSRLSSDGVRFMVLNFEGSETDSQVSADINFWMPLLRTYQMWVFLQVQHIKPEPPVLTTSAQFPRNQLVINTISQNSVWANMIFAYSFAWEDDLWFTASQITTYLDAMTPLVNTALANSAIGTVPIVSKPCGPRTTAQVALDTDSDMVGMDYYFTVTSAGSRVYSDAVTSFEDTLHNQFLNACGKSGYAIWHTEWAMGNGSYNAEITSSMFSRALTEMGYNDCGLLMIWFMWGGGYGGVQTQHAAFNSDGTPTQWYLNISSLLST